MPQFSYSNIFEIKEQNGTLIMETMNGFQLEIRYGFDNQISELNQIQTSKCTQNCKDCTRRQCYIGNTELDHSNIKMYDLETQLMVLQPLTYYNDQKQNNSISRISLTKLEQYLNSFIDDGFQLCQSQRDKTIETKFQINMKDIPQQQVLLSPIISIGGYNYIKINYLKFGNTLIDISQCAVIFNIGKEQFMDINSILTNYSNINQDRVDHYQDLFTNLEDKFDINYFPNWIIDSLSQEFTKAGFIPFQQINRTGYIYIRQNDSNNTKIDSKLDIQFFNKDNEQNPIIYSSNQYIKEFKDGSQFIKIYIIENTKLIILGKSFFENKKVQFNFKENFIAIQNYYEDRCFQYEKSSLYQQEILVLKVSIPLIILLTLFFIKYQSNSQYQ